MKNRFTILLVTTFLLALSVVFSINACQSNTSNSEDTPFSKNDKDSITTSIPKNGYVVYDLTNFSCAIEDAGGEVIAWQPDIKSARIFYTEKKEIEHIEILGMRADDASSLKIAIYLFKGAGVYQLRNDETSGEGIGMAEFYITENDKEKFFHSTQGSQVTISHFDEKKGIIAGTIDVLSLFNKGEGMMPDTRDMRGTFSGQRKMQ